VVAQYLICHLQLARQAIAQANYRQALQLLQEAENYPGNLGEGKLTGAQENDIHYLKGWVYELLGDRQQAAHFYTLATQGISEPVQAIFYNDPQPDKIFYQGLAWQRLQQPDKAGAIFNRLIQFGKEHMHDSISIDYFAVSLPDLLVFDADLNLRNKIHCLYLQALGFLGLGHELVSTAHRLFNEVLQLDVNHAGAIVHRSLTGL
jgi:tetratricopeptide (TPR) repeat protein